MRLQYMTCPQCIEHGVFNCRETVGTCDKCGQRKDVYMDYTNSGDRENPDETICLDCLSDGEHLTAPHEGEVK